MDAGRMAGDTGDPMRMTFPMVLAASLLPAVSSAQGEARASLFDGRSLAGWQGDPRVWSVQDGALVGSTHDVDLKANTFLIHEGVFGDFELRPSVVCEPQQLTLRLRSPGDDGGVLIIASDGLWARLDDADAVRIASDAGEPQAAAEALVREAARRGGADNMSVVVVRL